MAELIIFLPNLTSDKVIEFLSEYKQKAVYLKKLEQTPEQQSKSTFQNIS